MKLNNIKHQAGLTLIEVTLVIAVLLGLISVLFIGVSAYKEGSNRSKCILNISNVQKASAPRTFTRRASVTRSTRPPSREPASSYRDLPQLGYLHLVDHDPRGRHRPPHLLAREHEPARPHHHRRLVIAQTS
jgi:hypothetical protein